MSIKKLSLSVVLLLAAVYMLGCPCEPEIIGSVPNVLHPQQTNNWCWAATTQMLAQHVGIYVTQCDLANHRFGRTDCCNNQNTNSDCPKTDNCNMAGWLELDYAGVKFDESSAARTWAQLQDEIYCEENPMGYAYGTPGVVGHVVVIKGYITVAGTNYVVLNDPWGPCVGSERLITYNQYANPAGTATHWRTWFDLEKK
ncbi:MAG: hypothetical protein GY845_12220 [Planctomycetes bacterium]|nr:hypothetical protein [Planctomycetota bacterium]